MIATRQSCANCGHDRSAHGQAGPACGWLSRVGAPICRCQAFEGCCPICGAPEGVACDLAPEQGHTEEWTMTDEHLERLLALAKRLGVMGA